MAINPFKAEGGFLDAPKFRLAQEISDQMITGEQNKCKRVYICQDSFMRNTISTTRLAEHYSRFKISMPSSARRDTIVSIDQLAYIASYNCYTFSERKRRGAVPLAKNNLDFSSIGL